MLADTLQLVIVPEGLARLFAFGRPKMASRDEIRLEMRANTRALEALRADLVVRHPNSVALMRGGKVIDIFPSAQLAQAEGLKRFSNRLFSLHELRAHPRRAGSLAHL